LTAIQQAPHEAYDIRLDRIIGPAGDKLRDPPWAGAIMSQEVASKNTESLRCVGITQQP